MSTIQMPSETDPATLTERLDVLADRLVDTARATDAGLSVAGSVLRSVDRLMAAVVTALMATIYSGVVAEEGMTTASWLRALAGRTGADAGMLLAAAERLRDMPAVAAWFADGTLSWGAVRGIVAATRNLTVAQRMWIDSTLAEDAGGVGRLDADEVVTAVARLVDVARPDLHRDRAARSFDRQFVALQPALDGTSQVYGELDAETTALAMQAFATTPVDHASDGDIDGETDAGGHSPQPSVGPGRRNLEAFRALCQLRIDTRPHEGDWTGDAGASRGAAPSTARPSMLVVTPLSLLTGDNNSDGVGSSTAQLLWRTDRAPVELTAEATQRLACDATLRHVLVDGAQVLGVGAAHPKVSTKLRVALEVRDGGCRFSGCRRPVDVCENHHVVPVSQGGPTELDNLALLCIGHHHAVHEGHWQAVLHADASMTFSRRNVTLMSLPRGDQKFRPSRPPPHGKPQRHVPSNGAAPPQPTTSRSVDLPF